MILPCCTRLGIRLILVHGARPQINKKLKFSQIDTPFHLQRRVTTRESLSCVMNAVGSIRLQIESLLVDGASELPYVQHTDLYGIGQFSYRQTVWHS